jgi:hypothetical protein
MRMVGESEQVKPLRQVGSSFTDVRSVPASFWHEIGRGVYGAQKGVPTHGRDLFQDSRIVSLTE